MEFLDEIAAGVCDAHRFIRLTVSGPARADAEWIKIVLRPVDLLAGRAIQAVLQGPRKQIARNIALDGLHAALREFAGMGFLEWNLQCVDGDSHIRVTRKGKALISRGKPSRTELPADRRHDREKEYPLSASEPDEFLEKTGIMKNGRVLAAMQDKFRQINHFIELLNQVALLKQPPAEPIRIVDCGCGRALLTLAAYHHLHGKRGLPVQVVGVDADEGVIATAAQLRDRLGYGDDVAFTRARIADYAPPAPPHVVLSLHACDTATDDAISSGVKWGADAILCVPCCQHELHKKIARAEFAAVLRHGILRERTADILTDALRAAALRVMGYRAEVIEFINPGHTAKNLMIRAEKGPVRAADAVNEYRALRDFWKVIPAIETLLGEPFQRALGN